MATGKDWQRLADLVSERRADLGMTQEDVRAAGGPSTATQRLIEGGHQSRYQPVILGRLETALKWERGSVRRILAGGDPVPVSDEPAPAAPEPAPRPVADDAEAVASAGIIALLPPLERRVWEEIQRHPEGAPAEVIFSRPARAGPMAAGGLAPERQRITRDRRLAVRPGPPYQARSEAGRVSDPEL